MQLSPFLTVFPLFRSPSALRLREPTELLRRGQHSARARQVSFTCYVTRSPTKRTTLVGSLVLHPQGFHTQKTSERKRDILDESAVFCVKEKRSTKAKSKQLTQVTIVAKSLVCDASLALDAVGALRLHAPNKHIPLISIF